jgi:carboxylate-amine ligase
VEVRALDAQIAPHQTAALVALIHCLARHEAEARRAPDPPAEVVEEGVFRAARFGISARLPDHEGALRPVSQLVEEAADIAVAYADELGCRESLARLPDLIRRGGGAGIQRQLYEIAGMDALLRGLTRATAAAATQVGQPPLSTPAA